MGHGGPGQKKKKTSTCPFIKILFFLVECLSLCHVTNVYKSQGICYYIGFFKVIIAYVELA